jgi:hypothetical protein
VIKSYSPHAPEDLVAAVEALGFGDPAQAATAVGPVINGTVAS